MTTENRHVKWLGRNTNLYKHPNNHRDATFYTTTKRYKTTVNSCRILWGDAKQQQRDSTQSQIQNVKVFFVPVWVSFTHRGGTGAFSCPVVSSVHAEKHVRKCVRLLSFRKIMTTNRDTTSQRVLLIRSHMRLFTFNMTVTDEHLCFIFVPFFLSLLDRDAFFVWVFKCVYSR